MSDDNHGFEGYLVNRARKRQAAAQQQAPTRAWSAGFRPGSLAPQ